MTVDEILARGWYTDRRGRVWTKCPVRPTELNDCWWAYGKPVPRNFEHKPEVAIRLLIERDQHECDSLGLSCCNEHPVVSVLRNPDAGAWLVFDRFGIERVGPEYHEWSDALAAARALAVGE